MKKQKYHNLKQDVGVKWEEILVVTDSTAYWLDNELPHVENWKKKLHLAFN
jgi:hypothetical protein